MALPATGVLEVRSDGSATNSGLFNSSRVGATTDRTQQAAAHATRTDLVINASDATLISSVANPFSSLDIGNSIRQTAGVGFTVGVYEITNVDGSNRAVLDRAAGTLGSTGGTGILGGALATLANAELLLIPGMTVYVRQTSGYTTAATITLSVDATDGNPITVIGYATTRGDNGQATVTATNVAALRVLEITGAARILRNITADGANLSIHAIRINDASVVLDGCEVKRATEKGVYVTNLGVQAIVKRCRATANGTGVVSHAGFASETDTVIFDRCESYANNGFGFYGILASPIQINCLADGNTLSGFYVGGNTDSVRMLNCTSYGNQNGLLVDSASLVGGLVRNNIFAANTNYGIKSSSTDYSANAQLAIIFEANAFWNNTLGPRLLMPTGAEEVALTLDPFTDAANRDFSLNLSEGGGLDLRGIGMPGGIGLRSSPSPSVGFSDIGAVPASGATSSSTPLGTMRSLWRELTGEKHPVPVPDTVIDMYLQRGLEWANQALEYHLTTDAAPFAMVDGTQEYTLPEAATRVRWVELGGVMLKKRSIEQWENNEIPWRQETAGLPEEWAQYSDRIVFRSKPNAAAAALPLVIRYVSNPPDIGVAGPEQLAAQDYRIVVFHAVALWSYAYPDSALALQRGEQYLSRAREEAAFSRRDAEAAGVAK